MGETVYVVMGNDYPDAVFTTAHAAATYIELKKAENLEREKQRQTTIYWRAYDFELRER